MQWFTGGDSKEEEPEDSEDHKAAEQAVLADYLSDAVLADSAVARQVTSTVSALPFFPHFPACHVFAPHARLRCGAADGPLSSSTRPSTCCVLDQTASAEPLFWPRQSYGPNDLRFANVSLAALAFEETSEADFFEPCFPRRAR